MKKNSGTLLLFVFMLFALTGCGTYSVIDMSWDYDYAYISLPNGDVVEGKIQEWKDFEDGDQIQVKIDGVTYLTDTTRAVLVKL